MQTEEDNIPFCLPLFIGSFFFLRNWSVWNFKYWTVCFEGYVWLHTFFRIYIHYLTYLNCFRFRGHKCLYFLNSRNNLQGYFIPKFKISTFVTWSSSSNFVLPQLRKRFLNRPSILVYSQSINIFSKTGFFKRLLQLFWSLFAPLENGAKCPAID